MEKYRCKYFAKWHEYIGVIDKRLPKLRQFVFGHGKWHEGKNFDGAEMEALGLHEEMSYVFDKGTDPLPWMPVAGYVDYRTVEDDDDGWTEMEPSHIKLIVDQDRKVYD